MRWFRRKKEVRESQDALLSSLLDPDQITKKEAIGIPTVRSCLSIISGTVASLPIKLYQENAGAVTEIANDRRTTLLNDDPGDLLDGFQMKQAWVEDYLLDGGGYLYIERNRNQTKSLRYIESGTVGVIIGTDPIFKSAELMVAGARYREYEFLKILRHTKNGVTGQGIIHDNGKALTVCHNALIYENYLVKTGGNKKGFLQTNKKIDIGAMEKLKEGFQRMYQNNADSVIVLNEGLQFKEASNTSVEMQLNENKKTNVREMCKLFDMPPSILEGAATEDEYALFVKICINPILTAIEAALNRDFLLESEKRHLYFAFDRTELLKGDIVKRFTAYKMAIDANIMGIDEVRYREDLPEWGINFIKLGLQDVLYDPKSKEIYTPNTKEWMKFDQKGETENAHRTQAGQSTD